MNNTRRGFLASLLALFSMSRNANASFFTRDFKNVKNSFGNKGSTVGKIVFINNTGMVASMIISPSITATSFFSDVLAGGQIEATGVPNTATALGAKDPFPPYPLLPATVVKFPAINVTAIYYLNYTNGTFEISTTKVDPPVMN